MQHSEYGESLKSRVCYWCCWGPCCLHSITLQKNAFFYQHYCENLQSHSTIHSFSSFL